MIGRTIVWCRVGIGYSFPRLRADFFAAGFFAAALVADLPAPLAAAFVALLRAAFAAPRRGAPPAGAFLAAGADAARRAGRSAGSGSDSATGARVWPIAPASTRTTSLHRMW